MASRSVSNTASQLASSNLFNRSTTLNTGFNARGLSNHFTNSFALPNPNTTNPVGTGNAPDRLAGDNGLASSSLSSSPRSVLCNSQNIEYMVNQRYRHNLSCHKNLRTLQHTIGEKKRPCLFDTARLFGGTECTLEVFNGICTFHWSMLNLRFAVCEQYNTHTKSDGTFQHYELLVDVAIPDRALVPIFPNITNNTSLWDLLFGFTYASNRGLLTTRINEGAAMAYALYYMMDVNCRVEYLARSTYWVQNMTEYLMAFVYYNDELNKEMYASRYALEQEANNAAAATGAIPPQSVLKGIFKKDVYIQNIEFNIDCPRVHLPPGMDKALNEKDARLVGSLPPQSNGNNNNNNDNNGDGGGGDDRITRGGNTNVGTNVTNRVMKYKHFHIFVAPLILSLRPATFVKDMYPYAAPPVIGVYNIRFRNDTKATVDGQPYAGHSVFAIQGPIQYGVSAGKGNRNLPFVHDMPVCSQAYVATLGCSSNIDVNEDRIFATDLASFAEFTIPEGDQLFTLNSVPVR